VHDLEVPNTELMAGYESLPIYRRNPVRFWQMVSLGLVVVIVAQALLG
jgi:hypothetical protein